MHMSYRIELSSEDIRTLIFIGGRYAWSDALLALTNEDDDGTATIDLAEHKAWELSAAFESDTEGGYWEIPMLDGRSELARKLYSFLNSIV
jgi:hypothetical protein